jgi:N-acetylmuramoyl-L-alanine amidase
VAAPAAASAAGVPHPGLKVNRLSAPIRHERTFHLRRAATHVALHWRAHRGARIEVAFSRRGARFGHWRRVRLDEVGIARPGNETYGAIMLAPRARYMRVRSDVGLPRVRVLALSDLRELSGADARRATAAASAARNAQPTFESATSAVPQPAVIPRSGWGADESLRFDSSGNEIWPPAFYPVQKLIVHHTATQNNDPDPPATIRSIYYYHAITQGWGDIGYNFLIDEAGNVYEGRYSRPYAPGESPSGQDLNGNGVTGAHAQGYNSGTVGIALLGTLSNQDATPAARDALERLLAWEADERGIDPEGSALYTNPVSGMQATFPNIAGHRDVGATECPGGTFYATLPTIRSDVAARIAAAHGTATKAYQPAGYTILSGSVYKRTGAVSRLYSDDGSRLEISAAKSGSTYVSDMYAYASMTAAERSSLKELTIDYNGNDSSSGAAVTLQVYDFATGTWTVVDGPTSGVTSDRSFTWSNSSSPTDYVSSAGQVRFRVRGTSAGSSRTRTDLVRFTIAD